MGTRNLKNEIIVKGAGCVYTLRPTFAAMMAIEERAKKSLLKMIENAQDGNSQISDIVVILKEGTKAAGNTITDAEVETLFEEEGIVAIEIQLAQFFVAAMYGGKVHDEQLPKAEAESTESQ